jgi:Polyketide cyclase / dehydrase and lipid transport
VSWTIESIQEADVDPASVFALYADPSTWNAWGHNATWARADGPLVEGGTVDVRAGYGTVYHCEIRRLDPGRALELVVRPAFLTIINVYEVEPTAAGARVRHAFEVSGPIAGVARLGLARAYRRQLEHEVAAVIRLAKDPSAIDASRAAPPVSSPERVWHRMGRALRGGREEQR